MNPQVSVPWEAFVWIRISVMCVCKHHNEENDLVIIDVHQDDHPLHFPTESLLGFDASLGCHPNIWNLGA